jgi:prophage tail gpP-like protein
MENKVLLKTGSGNGITRVYEGWTDISIKKSLENLSGSFSIGMTQLFNTTNTINGFTIREGDKCLITIDEKPIINGYIDTLNINYSKNSHSIQITGRDKTADLVDSSLMETADLNAPYTAKQLVENTLRKLGLQNDIKVIDNINVGNYEENFDAGAGKNAWKQLDKYLQKKSIFATVNTDGNIVLFRGSFGQTNNSLFNLIQGGNVNNILRGSRSGDFSKRFNKISVLSQSQSLSSDGIFYEQGGDSFSAIDSKIRSSRQLELVANANLTSEECKNLADFQKNIRQARGSNYTYQVQGFKQTNGDLWLPNYEVFVQDEFFGLQDNFLIKSVVLSKNKDNGTTTNIELVDKLAYTLREPVAITKTAEVLFQQ